MADRRKSKDSARTAREKAAAARAEQQAAERRRERMVRIIGAVAVLVVVGGIIVVAVLARSSSDSGNQPPEPNPAAALPKGVLPADSPYAFGVPYGDAPDTAPVLAIWEDFQCPACGSVEAENGQGIQQVATDGSAKLVWRPTAFLDRKYPSLNSNRAISAWGCAIDQGKTAEYHDMLYANQPATEGEGWTDEQLLQFGKDVGIDGAAYDTFATCVKDRAYFGWAANSSKVFFDSDVGGTPSASINGQPIDTAVLTDQKALEKAIADAASSGTASPSASASQ